MPLFFYYPSLFCRLASNSSHEGTPPSPVRKISRLLSKDQPKAADSSRKDKPQSGKDAFANEKKSDAKLIQTEGVDTGRVNIIREFIGTL